MKKKLLASAIASALVVGVGAEAADVKISGQVSRAVIVPDDESGDELQFVDNNNSGSRFRIKGSQDIGNGMEAGFRIEMQVQSNKGNSVNGGNFTDSSSGNLGNEDNIDLRYQDVYMSGGFGKISLGKGDGAGNGATEVDLSGTAIISGSNMTDLYGGFTIGDGQGGTTTIGKVYDIVDANSRVNRVRYDSNNFGGFSFAASYGQQEASEVALKFAGDTGGIKYEVRGYLSTLGETGQNVDDGNDSVGLSGSVLLGNGLNVTATWNEKDSDLDTDEDRENMWIKLGYKMGKHAFAVDYGETEDTKDSDPTFKTEADTVGVSYVFTPAKGVELFAAYREYGLDNNGGIKDPEFYTFGSRVKF